MTCFHRREFSKRSERKHIEPAGEGQTDGVKEQMVERETRGRSVSGLCDISSEVKKNSQYVLYKLVIPMFIPHTTQNRSWPGNLLLDMTGLVVIFYVVLEAASSLRICIPNCFPLNKKRGNFSSMIF